MQPDTTLVLGDFTFAATEIPSSIRFGGEQHIAPHNLIGGARVLDSMGPVDAPVEWSGIFLGTNALSRALYLDSLRRAGQTHALTWGRLSYQVIVRSFWADYHRQFELPYRIACEVQQNNTQPVSQIAATPIDAAITGDYTSASGLSALVGDSNLTGLMGSLGTAISAVSSFAKASSSTIKGVLAPLAAVRAQVGILQSSASATLSNVTSFGGLLPNNPAAQLAKKLEQQSASMTQSDSLYRLNSVLGRMGMNLGTIGTGAPQRPSAGGNLFSIAAQQYGSAGAWTSIAQANELTDPFLDGPQVLSVPSVGDDAGGVLQA
ncbi:MAG: hypothetical protein ACRES6_09155 [Steroidobacteraceae bacterium]